MNPDSQSRNGQRNASWLLLCGAIVFAVVVRSRVADFPLERDEGEYAYAGQLLLRGIPPYQLAYNMKLPGTYLAYAGLMAVFGQTAVGVHMGLLVVNVATIALLYLLTRDLFDGPTAGGAALVYAVLSVSESVLGMAGHATHFVALFSVAGTAVLWRALRSPNWRLALGSGVLFGLGFLMKQQGVFLLLFGGVFLAGRIFGVPRSARLSGIRDTIIYGFGSILPYLLTCWWLWSAGVWNKFKFWTIEYAAQYVQQVPWNAGMILLGRGGTEAIGNNFPLWLLAGIGLISIVAQAFARSSAAPSTPDADNDGAARCIPARQRGWFVCGYLAFAALTIVPGLLFRPHYFLTMLPVVSVLASVGCGCVAGCIRWTMSRRWRNLKGAPMTSAESRLTLEPALPPTHANKSVANSTAADSAPTRQAGRFVLTLAVAVGLTVFWQKDDFFVTSPEQLCRQTYGANPFSESPVIAEYLRENSQPADTIAVFGSEPQLFFLSQRLSCTGYIYTYPLGERQPLAPRMQEEMVHEIEQGEPLYFIDVHIDTSWLYRRRSRVLFDWKDNYLTSHYERVGLIDVLSDRTVYRWGHDVNGYAPESTHHVAVYRRR